MTTTPAKIWTEEELLDLPHDGQKYELVDGELHIMSPAGFDHGSICINIASLLREFCRGKHLGVVADGQTGFYMKNGDLFSPDVSFVSMARWKRVPVQERGKFFRGSADLAVEVLSASEPRRHIKRKVKGYLENDTALAWVVDPVARVVVIHSPGAAPTEVGDDGRVSGDPVLPGFSFAVAELFEDADVG
jgi:Uma2 family endonuclease